MNRSCRAAVIFFVIILLAGCAINRLQNYEFTDQTAAAILATPPRAQVFSEGGDDFDEDESFWKTALKIGTTIAREVEAGKAQKRLDSAMAQVDIPEHFRKQTLEKSSEYLYYQPVEESKDAGFVFMMRIKKYGIAAKSWDAGVYFKMVVKISLIDNGKNKEIWKRTFREREPVSRGFFGLGDSVQNLITMSVLADLTEEEMITGFTHLAEYMGNRIAEKIKNDLIRANN